MDSSRLLPLFPVFLLQQNALGSTSLVCSQRQPSFLCPFVPLGFVTALSLLLLSSSRHSWSHGLFLYFNHLLSSLPSVPCLPRGRNQGGAGQWARKTPSAFGAGDLLSNCPDKGRTSQPEGVVAAEDTSGGSLACGLGPPAFPFSPQQPGCAPPFLLSQEKTLPSAYPGPVRPQSLASNYLLPGANLVPGLLSAPASGVAHVLSIQ